MPTEKLSISFDPELAVAVREAAAEEGVSVSTWLSQAAEAKARRRHLRDVLDLLASENGALDDDDVERIITEARTQSVVVDSTRTPRR